MMAKIRAFLALNVNMACARAASELQAALRREIEPLGLRIGWVNPANFHLTLKFLGWTREEALEAVVGRLKRELADRMPFEVKVGGLGAFPSGKSPRVLFCGIEEGTGRLSALAREVDAWMSELGFIKEE